MITEVVALVLYIGVDDVIGTTCSSLKHWGFGREDPGNVKRETIFIHKFDKVIEAF